MFLPHILFLMDELTHMSSQATKAGQYKVVVFDGSRSLLPFPDISSLAASLSPQMSHEQLSRDSLNEPFDEEKVLKIFLSFHNFQSLQSLQIILKKWHFCTVWSCGIFFVVFPHWHWRVRAVVRADLVVRDVIRPANGVSVLTMNHCQQSNWQHSLDPTM